MESNGTRVEMELVDKEDINCVCIFYIFQFSQVENNKFYLST